jgi:branched-chain amino acid transport system substrate-binding protein
VEVASRSAIAWLDRGGASVPHSHLAIAADAEFARNAADGARENAKKAGLKIVYDKTYPPPTADFAPIVRAIAATNPEVVVICS